MKASTLVLLVATFAEIKQSGANSVRGLHRAPYGKAAAFLGGDIDDKCEALQCPDDPSELDCTIEKPIRDVNWSELSDEDRVAHREEVKARREQLVLCACCTDSSIKDLLPEREGGRSSFINRGHKGRKHKFMKMMLEETIEDECDALSCPADVSSLDCSFERPERPDIDMIDLSREEKLALREGAKSKFDEHRERLTMCVCCTDSSVEDLLPDRADRLERLQDLLDSSTSEDGAGEDDSEDEAEEEDFVGPDADEQVDTAVLLSQANSQEGSVETQEFLLASSSGLAVASFSLVAVPLAIATAMM